MSSKRNASMIFGISMALETCLILGEVSLNLLYCKRNVQKDFCVVREEINEKTAYIQARSSLARTFGCKMGNNFKLKEKEKWSHEKLHLENLRKLRGICFFDPEDKECNEKINNARKKLETSVAPAMPCKIMKNCWSGASNKIQTKLACILEAGESTRMRMGNSTPHHHEDHIAGKGENSLQHYNLVHKFIPMPQSMKNSSSKGSSGQGMGTIGDNTGMPADESQK